MTLLLQVLQLIAGLLPVIHQAVQAPIPAIAAAITAARTVAASFENQQQAGGA